jgi:hypothetical protein
MTTATRRDARAAAGYAAVSMLAVGAFVVLGGLAAVWAEDGPHAGRAAERNGWQWMAFGDVLLTALALAAALLAAEMVLRRGAIRPGLRVVGLVLALLATLAILGVAFVAYLTDFAIVMDPDDLPRHTTGAGPAVTIAGLVVLALGAATATGSPEPRYGDSG